MKPDMRSQKNSQIKEDLEEVKKEIYFLEKAREKARNVNADERALVLTKEMNPIRQKRRHLEELSLLQHKKNKSFKDKVRRQKKKCGSTIVSKQHPRSFSQGSLVSLPQHINVENANNKPLPASVVVIEEEEEDIQPVPLQSKQLASTKEFKKLESVCDETMALDVSWDKLSPLEPAEGEPFQLEPSLQMHTQLHASQNKEEQRDTSLGGPSQLKTSQEKLISESFLDKDLDSHH